MSYHLVTSLESLDIDVKIGVTPEERANTQKLGISFRLYQDESECMEDDNSESYICYAALAKEIKQYCESKEFKLIEFLCFQLYKLIKKHVNNSTKIYVSVVKPGICVDDISFDAKAEYSDLV